MGSELERRDEAIKPDVICGERESRCVCVAPVGHDGAHRCDNGCGGSWEYLESGEFVIRSMPSGQGRGIPRSDPYVDAMRFMLDPLLAQAPITTRRDPIRFVKPPTRVESSSPKPFLRPAIDAARAHYEAEMQRAIDEPDGHD